MSGGAADPAATFLLGEALMYQGDPLLAPYRKFRASWFDTDFFSNGEYSADIMGCNWTCEGCWSKYGWKGVEPKQSLVLTPEKVVTKLIRGMKRNTQSGARISGGEPTFHWEHLFAVAQEFMERTSGVWMEADGLLAEGGEQMGLVIDSNMSLLDYEKIDALEALCEDDTYARIVLIMGIKATHPESLADLTGLTPKSAERQHQRQMDNMMYVFRNTEKLGKVATFLDHYSDPEMFAALQREVERRAPDYGESVEMLTFKDSYGDPNQFYTPKRFRVKAPDVDEHDPEILNEVAGVNGDMPDEALHGDPVTEKDLDEAEEGAPRRAWQEAMSRLHLPEGRFK